MSDHRETDDRLKSRLNSDQIARERMCTAILALDRRYTRVEPRRPEGGPDKARDLQAFLADGTRVFGAVGFQNSVTDSAKNKRETKKKFSSDLVAALGAKPDLKAFVFFTNVDLTPGDVEALRAEAARQGVDDVDVYWRERIRGMLDSPVGLGLRYQYLKIELSSGEQAAFFNSYNKDLEDLILKQHERLDDGVRRLEFLHWMSRPLQQLRLSLELYKFVTADEMGPFRVLARLFRGGEMGISGWYIGGADDYGVHDLDGQPQNFFGQKSVISIGPEPILRPLRGGNVRMTSIRDLIFAAEFRDGYRPSPEEVNGCLLRVYATPKLAARIASVQIEMNGYVLVQMPKIEFGNSEFKIKWPIECAEFSENLMAGSSGPLMLPWVDFERTAQKAR
jgi:hypothetical protein